MQIIFSEKQSDYQITAKLEREGQDILIQLVGGDVPHFGVVTGVNENNLLYDIQMPSRKGHVHQETVLTHEMIKIIQPVIQGNVFIVSGVHVNNISKIQMQAAFEMVGNLAQKVKEWIIDNPGKQQVEYFAN